MKGAVSNAINMPSITAEEAPLLKPFIKLADVLGAFVGQVTEDAIKEIEILYDGATAAMNTKALTSALLAGLIRPQVADVNMVSAPIMIKEKGVILSEVKRDKSGIFDGYIKLTVKTNTMTRSVAGTVFSDGKPRFIQIKNINLDADVGAHMVYITNTDVPGMIGFIGTTFGNAGVNIANFHLGRDAQGGDAIALLYVDGPVSQDVLDKLTANPAIRQARPSTSTEVAASRLHQNLLPRTQKGPVQIAPGLFAFAGAAGCGHVSVGCIDGTCPAFCRWISTSARNRRLPLKQGRVCFYIRGKAAQRGQEEMTMLSKLRRFQKLFAVLAVGMAVSLTAVDMAEARRAGGFSGFGSRGTRTYSAPATTNTAPGPTTGIQRSMTPNAPQNATTPQPGFGQPAAQPRRGLFGGMAGGLLGGLALGGLFGMMMGNGFGGGFGFLGMLLQIGLLAMLAMWAMRAFARRGQQAGGPSGGYGSGPDQGQRNAYNAPSSSPGGFQIPKIGGFGGMGGGASRPVPPRQAGPETDEIGITNRDFDQFEKMLQEVQAAYAAEDYSKLRMLTTPEAMSYLAEELGENATKGVKNEVKDVKLLQGDLSEAWRENGQDYATVAMRYSSVDFMRDRDSGRVADGDPSHASETVEVWTFVRKPANDWKVSAIQSAA
jgi:predicted lipid-binding transport protein (Tim44 family)